MMLPFTPMHVDSDGTFHLPVAVEQAFPLFTPLGEKHWAEGWNPQFCYPTTGLPEVGAVFLTPHAGEPATVWVMAHYAPALGQISYARTTPQIAAGTVTVQCAAATANTTVVQVAYRMTALSEAGNAFLTTFAHAHDQHWISAWKEAILQYLHKKPDA